MSRLDPYVNGEPLVDRLAPEFSSVTVTGPITASATLTSAIGDLTAVLQNGRTVLATQDEDTRKLLEDILILLYETRR